MSRYESNEIPRRRMANTLAARMQQPPPENHEEQPVRLRRGDLTPERREMAAIARRLYDAYVGAAREWHSVWRGETHYAPNRRDKAWPRAAKHLSEIGCTTPERYIQAQFRFGAPTPIRELCGPKAMQRFEEYTKDYATQLRQLMVSDAKMFRAAVSELKLTAPNMPERRAWEASLNNLRVRLSPLFRYCIAVSEGLIDTAKKFKDAAVQQLLTDPDGYAECWTDTIPAALREEVAQLLRPRF